MAKTRHIYSCSACGAQAPKWTGQCLECGAWNTLTETLAAPSRGGRLEAFSG
ncbi:MAG: DNA repair protein RadA, partial [Gammaproteobacteria bacterium]|nr:DNA repair protein RadA [Gammaproteobacteria bacterium]NIR99003.1 DNA repair protein RadA [Gammaproteobacteria bacterium]NIT64632.1 DNA repair protein RadA [Gammaproteobacteria bacterium]NIV21605.1 DNA repair protein RadA [Gammaproteobacteria bacterium]NIX11316.1 DNA repair protein RadA [Gammaproteobacteria bacterium]